MSKRQKTREDGDAIAGLPHDALMGVLSKLSPEDIYQLCQVSKAFKRMCDDPNLWSRLFALNFGVHNLDGNYNMRQLYFAYLLNRRIESGQTVLMQSSSIGLAISNNNDTVEILVGSLEPSLLAAAFSFGDLISRLMKIINFTTFESDGPMPRLHIVGRITVEPTIEFILAVYKLINEYGFRIISKDGSYSINCSICAEPAIVQCRDCPQKFCEKHSE